ELVTNKREVAEEFKSYFDKLLNNTTIRTNEHTNMQYSSPSRSEINAAINKLKNNKAPGENHIVAELVKNSEEAVKNEMWKLINIIWEKQQIPEEWNTAIICPIFKKGNILETKNYRGITLLDTCYKILSSILLERLAPFAEEIVGRYQCGFRKGRSTTDQIFILNQVMEKHYEFNKDLYMVFIILGNESILAYADDIVILGNTRQEITQTTSELLGASKKIWAMRNLTFEKVENFKYLGVNINSKNDMHREVSERIASGNRCYHSISKLLKSKLLSRKSKTLLYTSYLRPVITYACETWSSTKGDSNRLAIFERKVLRNIFGPIYNTELRIFERRKNEDLYRLLSKPNITTYIKIKRMEWFGHVWRADGDIIKKVLTETIQKKRPIGRPRTRWKD
ncbi:Uncharacterized protein FWK35_00036068, partial [Aphis craccivora]